jgi:hypothetical protein
LQAGGKFTMGTNATAMETLNSDAREIVRILTGWDSIAKESHGQFHIEIPLFTGWTEQLDTLQLSGAWYQWQKSGSGVYEAITINHDASKVFNEATLRKGYLALIAKISDA